MKTSFDDVVCELTDMISELQEYLFRDYHPGNCGNSRYVNRKNRIEMLKSIREHYQGLSNLEDLIKHGKMVDVDPELDGMVDKGFWNFLVK